MASAGAQPPPHAPSSADGRSTPLPTVAMSPVAGRALFSTNLGQVEPRPVANPPDPKIVHSPNSVKLDESQQIDRYIEKLRNDFPYHSKEIFVGYYAIHDYFDPRDIDCHGEKFLESVLERIATQNTQAVKEFACQWSALRRGDVEKICLGTAIENVFTEAEMQTHGPMFLTLVVISIRNALEETARKQKAKAEESTSPDPECRDKQDPSVEQPRFERAEPGKVPAALLRIGLRQPQADLTVHNPATVQEPQPAVKGTEAEGPAPGTQLPLRRISQASTSTVITPALPRQQPVHPYRVEQSPRLVQQSASPNIPRVPHHVPKGLRDASTSHKNQSVARMSAMAPGFTPQTSSGPHGPFTASQGPSSPAVTPQGFHPPLYLPSAPFMQGPPHGVPQAYDAAAAQMGHDPLAGYPNHHGMQPMLSDVPRGQMPFFASPPNMPGTMAMQMAAASASAAGYMPNSTYLPSLSNTTNLQHGGPMQNMRQRRVSGPRQDFNHRSQPNRAGKSTRGGRRGSMRGNHSGANHGQPGFGASPHFQHPLPAPNTEPFPPYGPPAEYLRQPPQMPRSNDKQEEMTSVWVHNIRNMEQEDAATGLKYHFEMFLRKPVKDVRVSLDKNKRLFAHVNFANNQDAVEALGLHESLFAGLPLIVKVPLRFLTEEERRSEATSRFNHPDVAMKAHRSDRSDVAMANRTDRLHHGLPAFNVPYNQVLGGQQSFNDAPNSMGSAMACPNDSQPFMVERRASLTKQRSRGPSRTYEATADNPFSYSPQDARRGQTAEAPSTSGEAAPQMPPPTSKTPVQDFEQRSESRASSSASPQKRKKHWNQRGRDRSTQRSTSGTTTPEPSTISSADHTTDSHDVASHSGNEDMVDKSITTILESREQEKSDQVTSSGKDPTDQSPASKPTAEKKKGKKSRKAGKVGKASGEKTSELGASDKLSDPIHSTEESAAEQPEPSKDHPDTGQGHQLEPRRVDGAPVTAEKVVTTIPKPNMIKIPVPDITIHSRKEKPGAASSAGRFSYAQAAAAAKRLPSSPNAPGVSNSPPSERSEARDNESRYFTPMDTPTSPPAKPEKTTAPGTPLDLTSRRAETPTVDTPDKDDSFVTVQEEPSSAEMEANEQAITQEEANKKSAACDVSTPASEDDQAHESNGSTVHGSGIEMMSPTSDTKESWTDEAVIPEAMSVKSEQDETTAEGSVVSEASFKTARDTFSIHPNARQKADKKKPPKKGKSYGEGKKGASTSK